MRPESNQYTAVAIVLHWAIATAIVGNLALGWWMHEAIDVAASRARAVEMFQLHKSIGLTVLLLSLFRLAWRLLHRAPEMPAHMKRWERIAAKSTHWAFYGLMMAMPLSGWLYVSTQWRGDVALNVPTLWFGWIEAPHLFGLNHLGEDLRQALSGIFLEAHEAFAWGSGLLLLLHMGAALKHHFIDHDEVLAHMIPALADPPKEAVSDRGRRLVLGLGLSATLIAALAVVIAVLRPATESAGVRAGGDGISTVPGSWIIDADQSYIRFSGTHAGKKFEGRFSRWQGDLRINVEDPTASLIRASVETASASDGLALHDRTLPQKEWFDSDHHPVARFESTRIQKRSDGAYSLDGVLRIKQNKISVKGLSLTVSDRGVRIAGMSTISRREADLGMASDPDGEWVSADIQVNVLVIASEES